MKRSEATKSLISAAHKGKTNTEKHKANISKSRGGILVYIYDASTNELLSIQPSFRAAGRYVGTSKDIVSSYLKSGKTFRGYFFRASLID